MSFLVTEFIRFIKYDLPNLEGRLTKGEKDYTEQVSIISNALKKSKLRHNYICYRGSNYNPFEGVEVGKHKKLISFLAQHLLGKKHLKVNIV